jgi:methionyl aminopeptidase
MKNYDKIQAWDIVVEALQAVVSKTKVGTKLSDLDKIAEDIILSHNAKPYNKGYKGDPDWQKNLAPTTPFPNTLVVNVNSTLAHGVPTDYEIRDGDTIGFDLGVKHHGLCGDAAITINVGKTQNREERLVRYARLACLEGIKHVRAGVSFAEFGKRVENYIATRGFVVSQTFASHEIGEEMHETPIANYYRKEYEDVYFEVGKMYCIEPLITYKDVWGMRALSVTGNDWSWITRDGRRAAMFEHQVLVTEKGAKILTEGLF